MVKYNNSPIIESICEFKFTEDTDWDITVPGLIFEDVKTEYPYKEQRATQEISISPQTAESNKMRRQINRSDFAVFYKDDKKSLIQIGPRILSTSRLKPYHTWNDFKSQIVYAFGKLSGRSELKGIQRIGLRYINRINIPMKQNKVTLENYFEFRPYCGPNLPQSHGDFIVGCVFPYYDERDVCKVELRGAMPENKYSLSFLLSIDYFLAKPRSIPVAQSMEWVENAHTEIEVLFEGCILPSLREILKEAKE
jgi:uncharacterized protein (TIGR04255 family)